MICPIHVDHAMAWKCELSIDNVPQEPKKSRFSTTTFTGFVCCNMQMLNCLVDINSYVDITFILNFFLFLLLPLYVY